MGEEIIDKRKLQQSINIANLQSYVEYLPFGYNTMIGPEGLGLSQGQKQRILIARAVYKEPDFLFLTRLPQLWILLMKCLFWKI